MTFSAFCSEHGFEVPPDIEPGRWYRVPTADHPRKKNGAIKLAEDGRAGWAHNHATMDKPLLWRADSKDKTSQMPVDARLIAARRAERQLAERLAAESVAAFFDRCSPLQNGHPYLVSKCIEMRGCHGLRVDSEGRLVIPIFKAGKIISLQRIADDGSKRFWHGATVAGGSYRLERRLSPITIFCEGFATAATLFEAVPDSSVICCFNAGNLGAVVFKPAFGLAIVAGDNDLSTAAKIGRNPGLDAARNAAAKIGARVAVPPDDGELTDWNDFFTFELSRVRQMEMPARHKMTDGHFRRLALAGVRSAIQGC